MTYHLKQNFNIPLEREYEGWLATEIENYFNSIGLACDVIAVSPDVESIFPADEFYLYRGKLVGLQIKRVNHNSNIQDLKWKFSKKQHDLMLKEGFPIYYALPTFFNREIKKEALHHFVFYKATESFADEYKTVNYIDEGFSESISIDKKKHSICRWGKFSEMVFNCSIGKKISFSDPSTKLDIKLNKILNEPNGKELLKRILSIKDVFNMGADIIIDAIDKIEFYKEYLTVLKETNNDKIDSNENEEVLLLIIIKS